MRQFHEGYDGILEVWIRSAVAGTKIANVHIQLHLNSRFESIASIKPARDKVAVVFGDRGEANQFVSSPRFSGIVVSIPDSRVVDIVGAVRADEFEGLPHPISHLPHTALGYFGAAGLAPCRILNATQLPGAVGTDGAPTLSNTVKITFEGNLLPKFVGIRNLRIPVRLYTKAPMFCETCQSFGHTIKRCQRNHKCARCDGGHRTADCTNPTVNRNLCPRCAKQHPDSRALCPYFQQVAKDYKAKQIAASRQHYQQTVASLRVPAVNAQRPHRQAPALNNVNFPPLRNGYDSLAADPPDDDPPGATDDEGPGLHAFPAPPKNPYAVRPRGRSTGKRRRDGSLSVSRQPARQPAHQQPGPSPAQQRQPADTQKRQTAAAQYRQPVAPTRQPQRMASAVRRPAAQHDQPGFQSAALRLVILTLARQLGLSVAWMAILEAVIDPLLEALLPNAGAIVAAAAAVTPLLQNIQ